MIIAIATNKNELNAEINIHFGRSQWFYIFDRASKTGEFIENNSSHEFNKAGFTIANNLINRGVMLVVAGRFGSKVVDVLKSHHIQMVIPNSTLTLQEFLNNLK